MKSMAWQYDIGFVKSMITESNKSSKTLEDHPESKANPNPPRQSTTSCLTFPIWSSRPKEISAARRSLTLYNSWKLQCHLKTSGSLCKDCGTGQPKGFYSRGTCICTFLKTQEHQKYKRLKLLRRVSSAWPTGRTHFERWAEDVSSWKPQHGALPRRGWAPTEWDQNDRGLARADGFVITPTYTFH